MNVGHGVLVMRSKPYRNSRIIDVIRDAFFRGSAPFTSCFNYLFPTTETHDGTIPEVPIPMVALVATALFATLYEWRSSEQVVAEFSANSYLDVYRGHVNTLNVIRERRGNAFRSMMAEIYSRASATANIGIPSGVPVAELNIDELEE
ncbi:hypothetical protein V8E53_008070 [Lactarius tabidus]